MKAPPIRDDGLQVQEERGFQRIFWTVERIAWAVFALVLLVAILGLTGSGGYLSRATQTYAAGEVDYPRFSRWEASDEMLVSFEGGEETHRLSITHSFFEYLELEGVAPEPENVVTGPEGVVMEFAARQAVPVNVILYVRGMHPGIVNYQVGLNGSSADVSTVILP